MFERHLAHAAIEKQGVQRGPDCAGVVGVMLNYRSGEMGNLCSRLWWSPPLLSADGPVIGNGRVTH